MAKKQIGFQSNMFDIEVDGERFTTCKTIYELRSWLISSRCRKCSFCEKRKLIVPGEGDGSSGLCMIGQGPGMVENTLGAPFKGRSGELLDRIMSDIPFAWPREQVYITNIVKCYGGKTRDGDAVPKAEHIQACMSYLNMEMRLLKPRMILAFGQVAWHTLCPGEKLINGSLIENTIFNIPVFLSYHPAWALRKKGKAHVVLRNDIADAFLSLQNIKERRPYI